MALIGALLEMLLLKRLYDAPELMQLTATFAVVLIVRDAALALWGAEDLLGPRAPGLAGTVEIFGHAVPQYDLFLIVAARGPGRADAAGDPHALRHADPRGGGEPRR